MPPTAGNHSWVKSFAYLKYFLPQWLLTSGYQVPVYFCICLCKTYNIYTYYMHNIILQETVFVESKNTKNAKWQCASPASDTHKNFVMKKLCFGYLS